LENLVGLRELTGEEFSKLVGVDPRTFYNWRKAKKKPTAAHKARIIEVLGPGREAPIWDDPAFQELAICLGVRPARGPEASLPTPSRLDVADTPLAPAPSFFARNRRGLFLLLLLLAVATFAVCIKLLEPGEKAPTQVAHPEPVEAMVPETPVELHVSADAPWRLVLASGESVLLEAQPRNGAFSFPLADSLQSSRLVDLDHDGSLEAVVISLDTSRPRQTFGQVRIACFSALGKPLWTHWIDEAPLFGDGAGSFSAHAWSLEEVHWLDWKGDGRTEILVLTTHTMYPSLLAVVDADGHRIAEYMHAGHMRCLEPLPNDFYAEIAAAAGRFRAPSPQGSGPALALSAEFQEAPREAGLIVLAPGFAPGAYPAATPRFRSARLPAMQDAIYVRTPASFVAQRHDAGQNWPGNVEYEARSRTLRLLTIEEPGGEGILRVFDSSLRPIQVFPTDRFKNRYVSLRRNLDLPDLGSVEMARSVEVTRMGNRGEWVEERTPEVWRP
jgi:hypothetical protein